MKHITELYFSKLTKYMWLSPIVAIIIFYLSAIKSLPEPLLIDSANDIVYTEAGEPLLSITFCRDTLGHFVLYALLAFTLWLDLKRFCKLSTIALLTLCLILPITFGISMEYAQKTFFPPRAFEASDIIANSIGCIAGTLIGLWKIK